MLKRFIALVGLSTLALATTACPAPSAKPGAGLMAPQSAPSTHDKVISPTPAEIPTLHGR